MKIQDCHTEAIHVPGKVQSFGYVLGLDATTRNIVFYSDNIFEIFYFPTHVDLFGKKIDNFQDIFLKIIWSKIYKNLDFYILQENVVQQEIINLDAGHFYFNVLRTGQNIFFEFERVGSLSSNKNVAKKYELLLNSTDETSLWDNLLLNIDNLIDFDRLVIYRFNEDHTGQVIAERKKQEVPSLLHLHYPEFDIPVQARALYLKKKNRIFYNAYSAPVPLLVADGREIDMTYLSSRALSPIHAEYLRNASIVTSFSISLVFNGKLWGLVNCHSLEPKMIDCNERSHCEFLAGIAVNVLQSIYLRQEAAYREKIHLLETKIKEDVYQMELLRDVIEHNSDALHASIPSDGVVISYGAEYIVHGAVPDTAKLEKLKSWLRENVQTSVYASHTFTQLEAKHLDVGEEAAGILVAVLDQAAEHYIIWFRREYTKTIEWAGKPEKIAHVSAANPEDEIIVFSPRKSFEVYVEQVYGQSSPWKTQEVQTAEMICAILVASSESYYKKIDNLRGKLDQISEMMENFAHTVSHDFATPLTIMRLHAQQLYQSENLDATQRTKVAEILQQIDDMSGMMNAVLQHNRSGKGEVVWEEVAPHAMIYKLVHDAKIIYNTPFTEIEIGNCPSVYGDKTLVYQAFMNVINNAVKFSCETQRPSVEIWGEEDEKGVKYHVKDNGIGISDEQKVKVFKPFSRTEAALQFKGIGVGLSIVKTLMERMGGQITFFSKPKEETVFTLYFKKPDA